MQHRVGYILKRTQLLFRAKMDEALSIHDLTTPQYVCLHQLHADGGISNAELARRCFITPQTMHKIVLCLEKKGFLQRESDPENQRRHCTRLTEAGAKVLASAEETVNALESVVLSAFSTEDILQFQSYLNLTYQHLEQLGTAPAKSDS